jgi:CHRD domain-containing protein
MRKLAFLPMLLLVFGAAGCEDDPPTQPTPNTPTFAMSLLSSNEVPPVTGVEASCAGTVQIRLNLTRDAAQVITAATVDFTGSITGCPADTNITAGHIHEAPAGQNAGFVINTGITSGSVPLTNGAGSFTRDGIATTDLALVQRMLDNPAGFYFNLHSTRNGGGVIRAQLVRTN